ncbi:hypothetical protein [Oceanibium sediminis]|uniref:hypothetical protein n=1 Tax=Oceanibium sediminis TaxID=2026339 RepID=UPI000DD3FF71|nr:hypothetical protein [Oceanibium sediminis]
MRIGFALALIGLPLAACMPTAQGGGAVPTVFASAEEGCRLEAAFLTGVSPSAIRVLGKAPRDGGSTLDLDLGGRRATCLTDQAGEVLTIEL